MAKYGNQHPLAMIGRMDAYTGQKVTGEQALY